jgi:hypothetical protein
VPTSWRLLCAEVELRAADARRLPPALRQARERNLGLLRQYRRRGEFPHNDHEPARPAPCFIDAGGRPCAVAYLMAATGAAAGALAVARAANHARVREMRCPELEAWAAASGLTRAELARIQPAYPPSPEQLQRYTDLVRSFWVVGALGLLSVLLNAACFLWVQAPRSMARCVAALCGIVAGAVCLLYGSQVNTWPLFVRTSLEGEVEALRTGAYWIGGASIACACLQLLFGMWRGRPPAVPGSGAGWRKEE